MPPLLSRLSFLRLTALGIAATALRGRATEVGSASSPVIHHLTDTHHPFDDGRLAAYVDSIVDGTLDRPDLIVHGADLVQGAETQIGLREQLASAKSILDRADVPVRYLCHTHDRMGDPLAAAGKSFAEIIGQPFIQHTSLPGLDIYLVSGSVAFPAEYQPEHYDGSPPKWGFDIFDRHVLARFERFVETHPGNGGRRVL